MNHAAKLSSAERFKQIMEQTSRLTRRRVQGNGLDAGHQFLAEWQCRRLRQTYADFARQSRYKKAVEFFLTDLYGPVDFSQRDEDIHRVYPLMVKVLSDDAIDALTQGLALNGMTMELDLKLLNVLRERYALDPDDPAAELSFDTYASAYRDCDNLAQRREQIETIVAVGRNLEQVTTHKMILAAVRIARRPAKLAGFGELQSFIERGLSAFRKMGSATDFLDAVQLRESKLLEAIYARKPVPADVQVA